MSDQPNILQRMLNAIRGERAQALDLPRHTADSNIFIPSLRIETNPLDTPREQLGSYTGYVYAAVSTLAQDLRISPFRVVDAVGPDENTWRELPLHPVLEDASQTMSFRDLLEIWSISKDLTGSAFIHIGTTGEEVTTLQIIYRHWVTQPVISPSGGRIIGWEVQPPGRAKRVLPVEDVIFDRYMHPFDPLDGASPVEAFAISYNMDLYARAYSAGLMKSGAVPPIVLTSNQERLTPEQADLIRERWKDRYQGKPDEVGVLPRGTTVQQLTLPLKDQAFIEMAKLSKDQVLEIYKVPPSKLGNVEQGVSRANAETLDFTYNKNALWPRISRVQEAANRPKLMRRLYPEARNARLLFDSPVKEDFEIAARNAHEAFKTGALTLDEYKRALGFDPIGGEQGNARFVPHNVRIVFNIEADPPPRPEDAEDNDTTAAQQPTSERPRDVLQEAVEERIVSALTESEQYRRDKRYRRLRSMFAGWQAAHKRGAWDGIPTEECEAVHLNPLDERLLRGADESWHDYFERLKSDTAKQLAKEEPT